MNLRHAAALALAGWYLVTPPVLMKGRTKQVDTSAPISSWQRSHKPFASQAECEATKAQMVKDWKRFGKATLAFAKRAEAAVCISADDPRLPAAPPPPSAKKP